jgi:hypothetical protein
MGGLGLGPLIAGLLAQCADHPTTVVFEAYLAVLAAAGLALLLLSGWIQVSRRGRAIMNVMAPRSR